MVLEAELGLRLRLTGQDRLDAGACLCRIDPILADAKR